jgi:capsule polysaccharide export protein KpsE/RkpR
MNAGNGSRESGTQDSVLSTQSSGNAGPQSSALSPQSIRDDEISLVDIFLVLTKHKKLVLGLPFLAAVITAGVTLLMPNIYTGRAVIMPPQQQQTTAAAMLGQLGVLTGVAPSALGIKNPNDLYVGMLKSRTIADALIERFKLKELYEEKTLVDTRKALAHATSVTTGRDGLIVIEVDDKDPIRASEIANAYVEELEGLTGRLAVTEAAQRRLFFERQFSQAKSDLARAEQALRKTQEKTGIVQLDEQGKAMIEAVAHLRAQIAAREVELAAMRTYATEDNPEFRRVSQEISGLRLELSKMSRSSGGTDLFVATRKIPEAGLEYVRVFRDVKYAETIFELLAKQFELAKIDEARDAAIIQVVDKAIPADRKSKPRRLLIVSLTSVLSVFIAVLVVFLRQYFPSKNVQTPESSYP